ncbi:MAG: SdpI family protein [Treponema sp.]|nr:SdpI family protein [Treponema sp.]
MKPKTNLFMMFITSGICLLPLIMSFAVYNDLPRHIGIPVFGLDADGNHNRVIPRAFVAFVVPVIWMTLNVILRIYFSKDMKSDNSSKAMRMFMEWLAPACALFLVPVNLFYAMGADIPILRIVLIMGGMICIIFGNYMPKFKLENDPIAKRIKIFNNPDTYSKTNRLAGYLFIIGGIIFIIVSFLPFENINLFPFYVSTFALILLASFFYSVFLNLNRRKIRQKC